MIYINSFFTTKYSYSPKTQYHKIKTNLKVDYIFSILLFAPYTNSDYIINFILIIFLGVEISNFRKLLCLSKFKKTKFIILTIFYTTLMNQLTVYENINPYNNGKKLSMLKLTYFFKTSFVNLHRNTVNLKYYFILLTIPNYILRLISIYIMLKNGLNILYLCTKYESVLEVAIASLNRIKKNFNFTIKTT